MRSLDASLLSSQVAHDLQACLSELTLRSDLRRAVNAISTGLRNYDTPLLRQTLTAVLHQTAKTRPWITPESIRRVGASANVLAGLAELIAGALPKPLPAIRARGGGDYQAAVMQLTQHLTRPLARATPHECADATEFFASPPGRVSVCWLGPRSGQLLQLLEDVGDAFDEFIALQPDLIGPNSLVRRGLVKHLVLPDGSRMVSKKNDPAKGAKFRNESEMSAAFRGRLSITDAKPFVELGAGDHGRTVRFTILRQVALVAGAERSGLYAISRFHPYPTLEEVLNRDADRQRRAEYLADCRRILDYLFELGILWGDMAPRNMLVNTVADANEYILLDFEKSRLDSGPVPYEQRLEHARGPTFVEEFSGCCTLAECVEYFGDYFAPERWDCTDPSPVPFARPKREIVDLLAGRGEPCTSIGRYNAAEREVIDVRFLYRGKDGLDRRPTYLTFRVDHYLGPVYDRKTTELLIAARRWDVLDAFVDRLELLLMNYESYLLLSPACSAAGVPDLLAEPLQKSHELLAHSIDELYEKRFDHDAFILEAARFVREQRFFDLRILALADLDTCLALCERAWSLVDEDFRAAVETARAATPNDCVVLLGGGFGRREVTIESDIDLAVFAPREEIASSTKRKIGKVFETRLSREVEFYPNPRTDEVAAFLRRSPEYLIDFASGEFICGQPNQVAALRSVIEEEWRRVERPTAVELAAGEEPLTVKAMLRLLYRERTCSFLDPAVVERVRALLYAVRFEDAFHTAGFGSFGLLSEACLEQIITSLRALFAQNREVTRVEVGPPETLSRARLPRRRRDESHPG